jgi:hypothetical protein
MNAVRGKGIGLSAFRWILLVGLAGAGILGLWVARRQHSSSTETLAWATPYRNAKLGVKYVGDSQCAGCHREISDAYHRHSMGRSMALAGDLPIPGLPETGPSGDTDAGKGKGIEFTSGGLRYAIEQKAGRIIHSETRLDAQGWPIARVESEVKYAVGSGHRGRSYLIERDGFLMQSPISWYTQEKRWDLSPDSLARNNHFERPIEPTCLFCHADRFEPAKGTVNRYQPLASPQVAISCERCHGPGELHVQQPGIGPGGIDPTIVNPLKLEPRLRDSVCEQCHLGGQARVERLGRTSRDYRPGLPREEFLAVFVEGRGNAGETRSIGHVEGMHSSRCYQQSEGRLGCASCHDPHQLPSASERIAYYRRRCLDCHDGGTPCKLTETVRRQRVADDSCIQCHMPKSRLSNVAHTAETDHIIRRWGESAARPQIATNLARRDESPVVAFPPESSAAGKSTGSDRELGIALAGLGAERSTDRARLARLALPLLETSLKTHPDDLLAIQAKIIALTLRNQPKEALNAARQALDLSPTHERTLALTIPLLAGKDQREEAIVLGRRLVEVNPYFSGYALMMAKLLAQSGQWREAAESARAALRLDPRDLTARWIVLRSAVELKDRAGAREEAETYLRFDPPQSDRDAIA